MKITLSIEVFPADNTTFSCLTRDIESSNVPRQGDYVCVAEGWSCESVRSVLWSPDLKSVEVRLDPYRNVSDEELAKLFLAFGKDIADRGRQFPRDLAVEK